MFHETADHLRHGEGGVHQEQRVFIFNLIVLRLELTGQQTGCPISIRKDKSDVFAVPALQLCKAFLLQQFPLVNNPDIIRQQRNLGEDMAGDQDSLALGVAQLPDKGTYLRNANGVQTIDGFIQN